MSGHHWLVEDDMLTGRGAIITVIPHPSAYERSRNGIRRQVVE